MGKFVCEDCPLQPFLEGIGNLSDPAVVARFTAEARFIRAAQYFYLSQFFQDVPLVTKVLTKDEANTVKKNTKAEITDFIIKEFTEAAADLPRFKDLKGSETGRASKQASLAFWDVRYWQPRNIAKRQLLISRS